MLSSLITEMYASLSDISDLCKNNHIKALEREIQDRTISIEQRIVAENSLNELMGVNTSIGKDGMTELESFMDAFKKQTYKRTWRKSSMALKRAKLLKYAGKDKDMASVLVNALDERQIRCQDVQCDEDTGDIVSLERLNKDSAGNYEWTCLKIKK